MVLFVLFVDLSYKPSFTHDMYLQIPPLYSNLFSALSVHGVLQIKSPPFYPQNLLLHAWLRISTMFFPFPVHHCFINNLPSLLFFLSLFLYWLTVCPVCLSSFHPECCCPIIFSSLPIYLGVHTSRGDLKLGVFSRIGPGWLDGFWSADKWECILEFLVF